MGMFGDAFKRLATPDGLYTLGAALKDASAGGSDNMLTAQKVLALKAKTAKEQQDEAAQQQFAQSLQGLIGGQAAAAGVGGAPAQQAQSPGLNLRDPRVQTLLASGALQGFKGVGDVIQLGSAAKPNVQFDRGQGYDPTDTTNVGAFHPDLDKGQRPLYDGRGQLIGTGLLPGATDAAQAMSQADTTGKTFGTVFNRPNGDGSTSQVMGAQMFGGQQQGGPSGLPQMGASPAPGIPGRTLTPGQEAAQKIDFTAGAQTIAGAGDAKIKAQNTSRQYQQAFTDSLALDSNNLTGVKLGLAKSIRSLGIPGLSDRPDLENFVGTAEGLRQLTTQMVLPMAKELGANPSNKDAEIIMKSQPGLTTPKQVAAVTFASNAALQNKEAARQDFYANYNGDPSKAAMQKAWAKSPQSAQSIYQDPVWQKLTLNGKPAVQMFDKPYKDGKMYGIFMPGTPRAQIFEVH